MTLGPVVSADGEVLLYKLSRRPTHGRVPVDVVVVAAPADVVIAMDGVKVKPVVVAVDKSLDEPNK